MEIYCERDFLGAYEIPTRKSQVQDGEIKTMSIHAKIKQLRERAKKTGYQASIGSGSYACFWHRLESGRKTIKINDLTKISRSIGPELAIELLTFVGIGKGLAKKIIEWVDDGNEASMFFAKIFSDNRKRLKESGEWSAVMANACIGPILNPPKITRLCKGQFNLPLSLLPHVLGQLECEGWLD